MSGIIEGDPRSGVKSDVSGGGQHPHHSESLGMEDTILSDPLRNTRPGPGSSFETLERWTVTDRPRAWARVWERRPTTSV